MGKILLIINIFILLAMCEKVDGFLNMRSNKLHSFVLYPKVFLIVLATITNSICDEAVNRAPATEQSVTEQIQPQKRDVGLGLLSDCDTPAISIGGLHGADLDTHAYAPTYGSGYLSSGSGYLSSGSGSGYISSGSGSGYLSSGYGSGSGYLSSGSGYLSSGSNYLSSGLCKFMLVNCK